ncbi:short-chain fatty acid transporter [Enterovirga rhinocerotis]|uniref:Short-chain fatty acids transporter n=1 Tax=Enterovirga rhinocerotis TaxID=1339210 RepID=A0A4R7C6S9_9HYPH|nr:TIGR00366 family protein [Enterovirga rhinocerotis]TDR92945.1 short-chain fatty acids transporter [Enterovirga rhinocerotis]
MSRTSLEQPAGPAAAKPGRMVRVALAFTGWAERWFPDAFVFAAAAVVITALAALAVGAPPAAVAKSFGDGFWSLIPFTMQMAMLAVGGYVVATSPLASRAIDQVARWPGNGRAAVGIIAAFSLSLSLVNWGISLMFSALLARAMARRRDLDMDYRAAGAASILGIGATWALGLSSSAAQIQANAGSLPKSIYNIGGVIPFEQTIFTWQSGLMAAILLVISIVIALYSAPGGRDAMTAEKMGIEIEEPEKKTIERPTTPSGWMEHNPAVIVFLVVLAGGWLVQEFATKNAILAISNLNTYNLLFLALGMLLHWRPRQFVDAVNKAVPATAGVLIQFPLYGAVAAIMTSAKSASGASVSDVIATWFVKIATVETFPVVMGIYSAVLGLFIPSGGGKWIIEAPYVLQAAVNLQSNLGWAVQAYNAAEALPALINPFWMLPALGIMGLKARDVVGFSFLQMIIHAPVVMFLLWLLGKTFEYTPPIFLP